MDLLNIRVVSENKVNRKGLLGEHGLALWIEFQKEQFLFDTGQGYVLLANLKEMRLDPRDLQGVILSHGHFDHTGGLLDLAKEHSHLMVYGHPQIFDEKVGKKDGKFSPNGIPWPQEELEREGVTFHLHEGPFFLRNNLILTGSIPRINTYEDTGGAFYLSGPDGYREDPLFDDQALVIDTPKGLVVVLGCAHAGIINTLEYVTGLMGETKIFALIGGMHLYRASKERMEKTIKGLERYQIQRLIPLHCNGFLATSLMSQAFPNSFQDVSVGDVWSVE